MSRFVWLSVVVCCLWIGCQVASPAVGGESRRQRGSAVNSLPPVEVYPTGSPLPVGTYTHMVVGRCPKNGRFMAAAVNAPQGTIVGRWVGYDATASDRFFKEAWGLGVPVIVYTGPVVPTSGSTPPTDGGDPGGGTCDVCNIACAGDVGDRNPCEPDPQGDDHLWDIFGPLALDTAQAISSVASPAPPTLR